MFKKYRLLKWISLCIGSLVVIALCFGLWFLSLIPPKDAQIELTVAKDLPYLSENKITNRGKILAVVTSTKKMGDTNKSTGYELSELAQAYYVFQANGFEVDIASPKGGKAPVVIDKEDMISYDYAFLNDTKAQFKTSNTIKLENVDAENYDAIFFVGGKGAMFDFPDNKEIQNIVKDYYQSNKVIGAVCHGPAALVNVTLDNGRPLLENKKVSSFTNKEELLLISDAKSIFPFLLQEKIIEQGGNFIEGPMYLETTSYDKNLITGQNPWSTWKLAESMIIELGYNPKQRQKTGDENAVYVLAMYKKDGKQKAKQLIENLLLKENKPLNRVLLAKHSLISAMKGEVSQFFSLVGLVSFAKKSENKLAKI
ncbi:type 1 glutamine amidotransferase domain-containing protein [Seonamhaeicola sp. MEBiC1930]|uniref:type 1 glutamine amidotransferase domain-containing protein n=1 Tax=Seonamhaeicola sp. MEBiC01930 TaxID=2976768 RepID=UPI00325440C8